MDYMGAWIIGILVTIIVLVGGFFIYRQSSIDLDDNCKFAYGQEWRGRMINNNPNVCFSTKTGVIKVAP